MSALAPSPHARLTSSATTQQVAASTQQTAATAGQLSASATRLDAAAEALEELVVQFAVR